MKKIITLFLILIATSVAWGLETDLGKPKPAPEVKNSDPATGWNLSLQPAKRAVRERVVVQVPAPHPPTVRGHHLPAGHQEPYREVKSWNPTSVSHVDAKVGKLSKEFRAELKSEAQNRASADQKLFKRIEPLEEKNENSTSLWLVGILILGLTAVLAVGISQN